MYSFTTEDIWLPMSDGIRLSATLTIPSSEGTDEKFPVLLEYKPYRKDDSFYNFNQPNTYYFVRRGFIVSELTAEKFECIE
jgi:predicted acyl esterase